MAAAADTETRTAQPELFDLTGKVAIITGSSRGIGKAIAERMAEHGAKVVISSRKAGPCDEVAAAINAKHPGHAIAVPANISSKDDLQRLVDETRKAFGKIDILVCNAASNPYYGPMSGISDDAFRKILDNNIVSNHWLIKHGRAGDEGAEGRLDHHHLVGRRPARQRRHRRLQHLQGGRHPAGAQPGAGAVAVQHARSTASRRAW